MIVKRLGKSVVAVIVIVGLVLAARGAMAQWRVEQERVTLAVEAIDRQLEHSASEVEQQELQRSRERLLASVPRPGNLHWDRILVAGLCYGLALFPPAFLLRGSLRAIGQEVSVGTAIAAQLIGHAGKYVPGKAMVIVLRAAALSQDGVRAVPATIGVFLETFLMMAVGATLAAAIVVWMPVANWLVWLALAAAVLASLPTLPPILRRVSRRVTQRFAQRDQVDAGAQIGWPLFAACWAWSLLSWLLVGASFAMLISAIPSPHPLPDTWLLYAISTAAIGLAIVIGFASLIPGGAGVRELVLTTILGTSIGPVHAILAAILARVVYIVVEALLALLAWIWLRRHRLGVANRLADTVTADTVTATGTDRG